MDRFRDANDDLVPQFLDDLRRRASDSVQSPAFAMLYHMAFAVGPTVPRRLWLNLRHPDVDAAFKSTWSIAFAFTMVMTVAMTAISGTLLPDAAAATKQFAEDKINLILYALVCPSYVALSVALVGISTNYWTFHLPDDDRVPAPYRRVRGVGAIFIVLIGASFSISQYQYDLLTSDQLKEQYWFLAETNGVRVLNRAGFYYIIMNFALLCVSAFGALAYCAIMMRGVRDAASLKNISTDRSSEVVVRFQDFMTAIALARALAICYMFNTVVWAWSDLGGATKTNIAITAFLVLTVGVAGTRLPALFVERRVDQYCRRCEVDGADPATQKLLPRTAPVVRKLASLSDVLLGFGFLGIISQWADVAEWIKAGLRFLAD